MGSNRVCIDIGGTKMLFALLDSGQNILKWRDLNTPKTAAAFRSAVKESVKEFVGSSDTVNVAIPGRTDASGKVLFSPNTPLEGLNIKNEMGKWFKHVNVDNDANCFAVYEICRGPLKKAKAGLVLVWGTGVGGSIVINHRIYRGAVLASEIGHIRLFDRNEGYLESLVGGNAIIDKYRISGLDLHNLALKGDKKARRIFETIGRTFGRYVSSLVYVLDPEIIIIGGSFTKSWKFMARYVREEIAKSTIRKGVALKIVTDKFYVIKGCYFLDDYEKIYNKL
jgi:predicted NBD/HSP70 family sugar kinase